MKFNRRQIIRGEQELRKILILERIIKKRLRLWERAEKIIWCTSQTNLKE